MLYYERSDTSEEIDLTKGNNRKEYLIYHY